MSLLRRNLTIGAIAAATAGVTWALASDTVVLYPATITTTITLSGESLKNFNAQFSTPSGTVVQKVVTVPAHSASPYSTELIVDGGDPTDSSNTGIAYRPRVWAYLDRPGVTSSLTLTKNTPVIVHNTPSSPSASVSTEFNYTTYHASASVTVTGGTLTMLQIRASASDSQRNEAYQAGTDLTFDTPATTGSTWLAMVSNRNVTAYGTAFLIGPDGVASQRSLANQVVDLSQGP